MYLLEKTLMHVTLTTYNQQYVFASAQSENSEERKAAT